MPLFNPANISTNVNFPLHQASLVTNSTFFVSTTPEILLASNSMRLGATIYNNSLIPLFLDFGVNPTPINFAVKVEPNGYYEIPFNCTLQVNGVWEYPDPSADTSGRCSVRDFQLPL